LYKKNYPDANLMIDEKLYDPLSIMHYEVAAFATTNGRATRQKQYENISRE